MPKLPSGHPPNYTPPSYTSDESDAARENRSNKDEKKQESEKQPIRDEVQKEPTAGPSNRSKWPNINKALDALKPSSRAAQKQAESGLLETINQHHQQAFASYRNGDTRAGEKLLAALTPYAKYMENPRTTPFTTKSSVDRTNYIRSIVQLSMRTCLLYGDLEVAKRLYQLLNPSVQRGYPVQILQALARAGDADGLLYGLTQTAGPSEEKHTAKSIPPSFDFWLMRSGIETALATKNPEFFTSAIVKHVFPANDYNKLKSVAEEAPDIFLAELMKTTDSVTQRLKLSENEKDRAFVIHFLNLRDKIKTHTWDVEDVNAIRLAYSDRSPVELAYKALGEGKHQLVQALVAEIDPSNQEAWFTDRAGSNPPDYSEMALSAGSTTSPEKGRRS